VLFDETSLYCVRFVAAGIIPVTHYHEILRQRTRRSENADWPVVLLEAAHLTTNTEHALSILLPDLSQEMPHHYLFSLKLQT